MSLHGLQSWLWLAIEPFHQLVPFSHVNSHEIKRLWLTASHAPWGIWTCCPHVSGEHPAKHAWRAFTARLGTSCILNPSLGVEGSQVPEKSRKREWDCAAQWLWLWVGSPGLGGGEALVHQQCLGLMQWLPSVKDGKEHWQRHWEKSGQEHVSVRTFWTLHLQIIHLLSLFAF